MNTNPLEDSLEQPAAEPGLTLVDSDTANPMLVIISGP